MRQLLNLLVLTVLLAIPMLAIGCGATAPPTSSSRVSDHGHAHHSHDGHDHHDHGCHSGHNHD